MNTFDDFIARWTQIEAEYEYPYRSRLARLPEGQYPFLSETERIFLKEQDVPDNAPFFSFGGVEAGMPRHADVIAPGQIEDEIRERIRPYRDLGSDGGGNPIVLDERDHELYFLDHESYFSPTLLNSSLAQFLEFLIEIQRVKGQAPNINMEALTGLLRELDSKAMQLGAYWPYEIVWLNDLI